MSGGVLPAQGARVLRRVMNDGWGGSGCIEYEKDSAEAVGASL